MFLQIIIINSLYMIFVFKIFKIYFFSGSIVPKDPKQKEDELTSVNVKQGFINQLPFSGENGEYGTAKQYMFDSAKVNIYIYNINMNIYTIDNKSIVHLTFTED